MNDSVKYRVVNKSMPFEVGDTIRLSEITFGYTSLIITRGNNILLAEPHEENGIIVYILDGIQFSRAWFLKFIQADCDKVESYHEQD